MKQYLPYNILISGDPLAPFVDMMQAASNPAKRRQIAVWIEKARKESSNLWRPEPKAYEQRIEVLLNAIVKAKVGTVVLTSVKRSIPLWIVPYQGDVKNAITGQLSSELTRGVWVRFSPDHWAIGASKCARYYPGYGPTETLFHELIHASRFSNLGYVGMNNSPLKDFQDHEEFLAVMITNMLRSEWRAKKFARDYTTGKLADQSEMEQYLGSKQEFVKAMEYLLTDPFVKQVARMPMTFNPFRDLGRLKAAKGLP